MKTPQDVLDFWFSEEAEKRWFNSTPSFDARILQLFEDTATELARGPFPHPIWEETPEASLALIIALDQFPRNMFRDTRKAFAWDAQALGAAERMVAKGWDMELPKARRSFVYMPFMHAEDLAAQERCVELTEPLPGTTHKHAVAHRDVIAKFGRFPHRNAVLGRESTEAEKAFLADGGYDPS